MANTCASIGSLAEDLALLEGRFPEHGIAAGEGIVSYRECGSGHDQAIVLLHGIGSGAASWLHCALKLEADARVIAWNAPGYGRSTPLTQEVPKASDYARRLAGFLDALGIGDCLLVGHSLGALMAAAHVSSAANRAGRLILLSPAQGYGSPARHQRGREVLRERLAALAELGVAGIAERRSANLVSPAARDDQRAWVRWNMQQLNPAGYRQAAQLLCGDDIHDYLPAPVPTLVACGTADAITKAEDSARLATEFGLPYQAVPDVGHACYVERPNALAALIHAHAAPSKQH